MRATLRLTLTCNNHCIFCSQRGLSPTTATDTQAIAAQLRALRAHAEELTFVGGEPALASELTGAIVEARSLGFSAVGLQTNGSELSPRAAAWAKAGLTDVHVSLHGADARVHDYHTGEPGSFARLVDGLAAARAAGLTIAATTVLTRSNFRQLAGLPRLLRASGVAAWLLAVPHAVGAAADAFDRVIPRLGLALPFALHALERAATLGLPAYVQGAPLCLLGPFAARAIAGVPRAYAELCAGCAARPACDGVDARYLARFGGDELRVRALPPSASDDNLARPFVGAGELARPPEVVVPAPPSEVRRSLPLLGKVQPASAEAASSEPKRSGEALREIFPGLFKKE